MATRGEPHLPSHAAFRAKVRLILLLALACGALWLLVVGHIGAWRMELTTERRIEAAALDAATVARAGAQGLESRMAGLRTIPDLLAGQERFGRAIVRFDALAGPLPRIAWDVLLRDPELLGLSDSLASVDTRLDVDGIYVASAAGYIIASSDWQSDHSHLGYSFAGREHFVTAMTTGSGEQFGHDHLSDRPMFFFAHRVESDGVALGAVVVAVSSDHVLRRINRGIETVLVSDAQNIVVIASDRRLLYRHVGSPNPGGLDVDRLTLRYGRDAFDAVPEAFFARGVDEVVAAGTIYAAAPLPGEDMSIHVSAPVPALREARRENLIVVVGLATFGLLLTVGVAMALIQIGYARDRATRDPLTGLSNRRYADDVLPGLLDLDDRGRLAGFILVSFDLDRFKGINDTWGHHVGDRVLARFASIVMSSARRSDLVFRLGGEEFSTVLIEEDIEGALAYAERVRAATEAIDDLDPVPAGRITVSAGIAKRRRGEGFEALSKRADALLYRAKQNGRNRIECDAGSGD